MTPARIAVLDSLTLLLAAAALLVWITGGFKTSLADVRLSVTSPLRLVAWAIALTAIRHILAPRPSIVERIRTGVALWRSSEALAAVLPPFLVTRLAVLFAGMLAVFAFGLGPDGASFRPSSNEAANLMVRWDTAWYLDVATDGYRIMPGRGQQNYAFFPLYPMMVRAGGVLTGGHYLLSGFVISVAAFLGALLYVHALARAYCRDREAARMAVTLLAMYPFALFFSAVYTESLFLLCVAGGLYHLHRGEDGRSAAWAFLAGLTRPNGFLLSVPLAALLAARFWPGSSRLGLRLSSAAPAGRGLAPRSSIAFLAVIAPLAGMLLYSSYVYTLTGEPFAWASVQSEWGRRAAPLTSIVSGPIDRIAEHGLVGTMREWPFDTFNALGAGLALALMWPVTQRYGFALGLFVAVNLLPPLLNGGVMAMGRYTSVLFPLFFWLADRVPARQLPYWSMLFGMGQALAAAMFFTWRQLF